MLQNLPAKASLLLVAVLLQFVAAGQDTSLHYQETTLKEAIANKSINASITGVYDPTAYIEVVDKAGVHYGKCMELTLQNNSETPMLLQLPCGTMLIPEDDSIQKMIVTKAVNFELPTETVYRTRFYAMCSQMHLNAPLFYNSFSVGDLAEDGLLKLALFLDSTNNQGISGQHAVWAYTDNAALHELEEYGADSNTVKQTKAILDGAEIKTPINNGIAAPETDTIALDRRIIYAGIGLMGVLALSTIVMAGRRRRKIS